MYIGQRCWHNFVVKDARVKQVTTLNITHRDKIKLSVHKLYSKCH